MAYFAKYEGSYYLVLVLSISISVSCKYYNKLRFHTKSESEQMQSSSIAFLFSLFIKDAREFNYFMHMFNVITPLKLVISNDTQIRII